MLAAIISVLALLATFYQLHLQRVHNEKSLKPLVQIDLTDEAGLLYVHIQNNGVGPFIVEKLTFLKDGEVYADIKDCLTLSSRLYQYVPISPAVKKVILPGNYLEIFSKQFDENAALVEIEVVRRELAVLRLKVEGRDIYNNRIVVERELSWFVRHGA